MPDDHPTDDVIVDYLGEVVDDTTRRAIEAHLRSCSPCGARIARAAETELVLLTLGAEPPPRTAAIVRRPLAGVALAVLVAAGLALWLHASTPTPDPHQPREATTNEPPPIAPYEPNELAFVTAEQLQLPSSAELVTFIPEAE